MTRVAMPPYQGEDGRMHGSWLDPGKAAACFTDGNVYFADDHTAASTHPRRLYRTPGGRWALEEADPSAAYPFRWVTADKARDLLVTHFKVPDTEIARWLPAPAEERSPGRPGIGPPVSTNLPEDAITSAKEYAAARGVPFAAALRELITAALAANQTGDQAGHTASYTVYCQACGQDHTERSAEQLNRTSSST